MVRKMSMGEGVAYHKSPGKMRTIRVTLSPKQSLVLRKGGAITIKAITDKGTHEISLPEVDVKKLMTKLQKGVGGRIKLNGGSILQDFGRYIQPLSDAAIDRGRRELGSGMDIMYPAVMPKRGKGMMTGMHVLPNGLLASNTNMKPVRRRRGKGMFDFLDPAKNGVRRFFEDEVAPVVIDQGIPGLTGAIGGVAGTALTGGPIGGIAGSYIGKKAGEEAARQIRRKRGKGMLTDIAVKVAKKVAKDIGKRVVSAGARKGRQLIDRAEAYGNEMIGDGIFPSGTGIYPAGVNLRRGSGMNSPVIQLGTPYISRSSPAFNPVQLPNPFVSNSTVMRQAPTGGRTIRM
jgi:hypothetical protein